MKVELENVKPMDIEKRSFEIITDPDAFDEVLKAVQEAGDDNLTAIKLPSREHIFHQHIRVSGLQDGDGGNDTGQPSVSADDGGLTKGRQFQ